MSRKLSKHEINYQTTELEALALVWGSDQFRHYILGSEFIAQTDHGALIWLMKNQKPGRLSRWALRLAEYSYKIEHVPGKDNPADGPSRYPARAASDNTSSMAPHGNEINMLVVQDQEKSDTNTEKLSTIYNLATSRKYRNGHFESMRLNTRNSIESMDRCISRNISKGYKSNGYKFRYYHATQPCYSSCTSSNSCASVR